MSGASGGSTHAPPRCLYVALNVPRGASSSEVKQAYRREALVWHPDKNVGNEAEAQVRFQELQHAYAVLSDAHERKWYDDHRDEILNPRSSRDGGGGEDSNDDDDGGRTVNLTKYFSASAFTDFGDGESGFYQTYRRAFQEVWEAEKEWGDFESVSGSDIANGGGGGGGGCGKGEAPKMGLSGDSYEVADAFYASWSTFVSRLSFGWVDEHNVNEAENRRVRRLMEKENGKKRAVARRKYQDDVRALVEFCRRRDRRVIRRKLQLAKEKEARERQRAEEAVAKKADIKLRKDEWLRARQAEEELAEEERAREGGNAAFRLGESEDDEAGGGRKNKGKRGPGGESPKVVVFRCAVCKKDFKSAGQMKNHETSKAHKKKIEELDRQMLREARESGKRHARQVVGEDVSDSDENDSDEGNGEEEHEQEQEEEEEPDFFMDNAMRELDLGLGSDEAEGGLAGGSMVGDSRERAVAEGSLSQGAADLQAPQTDRELAGVEHAPRHEQQRPERKDGSGKGEEKVPRHGRRRERAKRGFDLFSSSSSGGDDVGSDTDSSSGGESESGSGWAGSGTDAAEAEGYEEMATIPMASASVAATRVDSGGENHAAAGLEAWLAYAETAHSAAQASAGLAATSTSAGMVRPGSVNLDVQDKEVKSVDDRTNSNGMGKVGQSGSEHEENGRKNPPRKDSEHRPPDHNSHEAPEHAARGGRKGGRQGESSDSIDDEEAGSDGIMKTAGAHELLRFAGKRVRRKAVKNAGHTGPSATGKDSEGEEDKGARRRRRQVAKAARAAAHGKGGRDRGGGKGEGEGGGEDGPTSCRVCGKSFPSRSKLFAHVKKEGHALAS